MLIMKTIFAFSFREAIVAALISFWTFTIVPVLPFVAFAIGAVFVNHLSGWYFAKYYKGEGIDEKKSLNPFIKLAFYIAVMIGSKALTTIFSLEAIPLAYMASLLLSLHELSIIYKNAQRYTGVKFWEALKEKITNLLNTKK